jgi:hypothetical protein
MQVRAKFKCTSVSHAESGSKENPIAYSASFTPVFGTMGESEENKKFWKYTPSGKLELNTILEMPFVVGKQYYLDISEADEPT